jgi:hypothetical protein
MSSGRWIGPVTMATSMAMASSNIAARSAGALRNCDPLSRSNRRAPPAFQRGILVGSARYFRSCPRGQKRALPCLVTNAGHALFTGIADPDLVLHTARTLMDDTSILGWDIRTIATSEARYNPMSYHNGSVWPHDNALVALGLARYGYKTYVTRIFDGLFNAAPIMIFAACQNSSAASLGARNADQPIIPSPVPRRPGLPLPCWGLFKPRSASNAIQWCVRSASAGQFCHGFWTRSLCGAFAPAPAPSTSPYAGSARRLQQMRCIVPEEPASFSRANLHAACSGQTARTIKCLRLDHF